MYDNGFIVGGTIFWQQLIVGIFVGAIGAVVFKLHTSQLVYAGLSVAGLLAALYVSYRVLKSEHIKDPIWMSFIGFALQIIISYFVLGIAAKIVIPILAHVFVYGVILVYIAYFVASYYIAKYTWAISFSTFGKMKNRMVVQVLGVALMALILGLPVTLFVIRATHKSASAAVLPDAPAAKITIGLQTYTVQGDPNWKADFYRGAKPAGVGTGHLKYSFGPGNQGVDMSVVLTTPPDASTPCGTTDAVTNFTFQSQGASGIVCVSKSGTLESYQGHIQAHGNYYLVNLFAFSTQQSLATVKAIFNSVQID